MIYGFIGWIRTKLLCSSDTRKARVHYVLVLGFTSVWKDYHQNNDKLLYEEVVTINSRRWLNTKQHLRTHLRP